MAGNSTWCTGNSCYLEHLVRIHVFFLGHNRYVLYICGIYIYIYIKSVARSSSMWLPAQHLHTSAECRESPVASLSSPELLSDLFTCSPHAAQAKRMRGIVGGGGGIVLDR